MSSTPQLPLDLDIYVYFWLVEIILNVCSFGVEKGGKYIPNDYEFKKKSGFLCLNIILLIQRQMSDKKTKEEERGKELHLKI